MLAKEVRSFAKQNDMRVSDVLRNSGLSRSSLSQWETGKHKPSKATKKKVRNYMRQVRKYDPNYDLKEDSKEDMLRSYMRQVRKYDPKDSPKDSPKEDSKEDSTKDMLINKRTALLQQVAAIDTVLSFL